MKKPEAVSDFVTRLLGGATSIIAAAFGADPVTALALGATTSTLTKVGSEDLMGRFRAAVELRAIDCATALHVGLCQRLASITDEDERRRVAEERAADPAFDDTLFEVWHRMITVNDVGVRPCLAYLGAEYSLGARAPDAFFRAASELLSGTTSDELPTLRQILEGVAKLSERGSGPVTMIKMPMEGNVGRVYARWEPDPCDAESGNRREYPELFVASPKFERVAARLKAQGFAGDASLMDTDPLRLLHFGVGMIGEARALLDCVRASPAAYAAP